MYFVCKMVMPIGQMLLIYCTVCFDAHSKWLEAHVVIVETLTSAGTIQKLHHIFAIHGIPETIVIM